MFRSLLDYAMFTVDLYSTPDGRVPVIDWLQSLTSGKSATRIADRLDRVASGQLGDVRAVGDGVWELRCHFRPGYRVDYSRVGEALDVLLCGGDKSTQKRDIVTAKRYLADYKGRAK